MNSLCIFTYFNSNLRQAKTHITVKYTIPDASWIKTQCFKGNLGLHKGHFILL